MPPWNVSPPLTNSKCQSGYLQGLPSSPPSAPCAPASQRAPYDLQFHTSQAQAMAAGSLTGQPCARHSPMCSRAYAPCAVHVAVFRHLLTLECPQLRLLAAILSSRRRRQLIASSSRQRTTAANPALVTKLVVQVALFHGRGPVCWVSGGLTRRDERAPGEQQQSNDESFCMALSTPYRMPVREDKGH